MNTRDLFVALLVCVTAQFARAELVITLPSAPKTISTYQYYYNELVILALEKTRTELGDYRIEMLPLWSWDHQRVLAAAVSDSYPNIVVGVSYEDKLTDSGSLTYIDFPIDGGIVGQRVCFVNPAIKEQLKKLSSLSEFSKYKFAHGLGWADTTILRHNGLNVVEVRDMESIYKMVSVGRLDFYCKGANQLLTEYEEFRKSMNLIYDESFVLVYPLPRFFYLNINSKLAKGRIEEGLKIAYKDGSFKALWLKFYKESVVFSQLGKRKVFHLDNPLVKNLSRNYEQYFIDPQHDLD